MHDIESHIYKCVYAYDNIIIITLSSRHMECIIIAILILHNIVETSIVSISISRVHILTFLATSKAIVIKL